MKPADLFTYYVHPCGTAAFADDIDETFFHGTSYDHHTYHLTAEEAERVMNGEWCPFEEDMNKFWKEVA